MSDKARELREALDWFEDLYNDMGQWPELHRVSSAARNIALPILERDPALVDRLANELFGCDYIACEPLKQWKVEKVLAVFVATNTEKP